MSWRKFGVLLQQLPRESRTVRHADPSLAWSVEAYLLAGVIDKLAAANWQRSGGTGSRPKPIPRPGDKNRTRMGTARPLSQVRQMLDRWRTRGLGDTHKAAKGGTRVS